MGFPIQVASRYAKSLMALAQEKGLVEEFRSDLKTYMDVFYANHDFNLMMHSPIIMKSKKIAVVKQIFEGKISEPILTFMVLIIKKNREDGLDEISEEFLLQYRVLKGIKKAYVKSATPLTDSARTEINELVKSKFNQTVDLTEEVDESLIGGYILRVDDIQIDHSVKSHLQKIKNSIS